MARRQTIGMTLASLAMVGGLATAGPAAAKDRWQTTVHPAAAATALVTPQAKAYKHVTPLDERIKYWESELDRAAVSLEHAHREGELDMVQFLERQVAVMADILDHAKLSFKTAEDLDIAMTGKLDKPMGSEGISNEVARN